MKKNKATHAAQQRIKSNAESLRKQRHRARVEEARHKSGRPTTIFSDEETV